jgi:hypothetical protein
MIFLLCRRQRSPRHRSSNFESSNFAGVDTVGSDPTNTGTYLNMNRIPKETSKCTVFKFQDPSVTSSIIVGLLRPVSITLLTALLPSAGDSKWTICLYRVQMDLFFRYWGGGRIITPAQQRQLTSQTLQTFEIVEHSPWHSVTNGNISSQIIVLYLQCRSFVTSQPYFCNLTILVLALCPVLCRLRDATCLGATPTGLFALQHLPLAYFASVQQLSLL